MSVWDIEFESADQSFGDALVKIHRITNEKKDSHPGTTHSHGYYELHLITKGMYVFRLEDREVEVLRGQMLIIPPDLVHETVVMNSNFEDAVLSLTLEKQSGNAGFYKCFTDGLMRSAGTAITISQDLVRKIAGYCTFAPSNSVRQYCVRKLAACEILVNLFQEICGNDRLFYSGENVNFDMMLETFVNDHGISLPDMAERLGYSQRQLSRIIKKRYGATLTQLRSSSKSKSD